jgi:hypothetical protein
VKLNGDRPNLTARSKLTGKYESRTYSQVFEDVKDIGAGIKNL